MSLRPILEFVMSFHRSATMRWRVCQTLSSVGPKAIDFISKTVVAYFRQINPFLVPLWVAIGTSNMKWILIEC